MSASSNAQTFSPSLSPSSSLSFEEVCEAARLYISESPETGFGGDVLELQKQAIIGRPEAVRDLLRCVGRLLDERALRGSFAYPSWYTSEEDAIYHEVWGRAGLAEWWSAPYAESGSAKMIGEKIFFQCEGSLRLMPQTMNAHRREQLLRGFLIYTPSERLDRDFHEIYLADGVRVTVYRGNMVKRDLDTFVFRRYIIPEYSFAEQAKRRTIPEDSIPLFKAMIELGCNVVFCGPVRSAKTTFLATWQGHEDPLLEGVMVETDPEVPLHRLMPEAPVVQLIADGDALSRITKNLLRSDADYFIFAEARDGVALDVAFRMARKGRGRMKMTFHTNDPGRFAEDSALEVVRCCGGDLRETALRAAAGFDYIFHLSPLGNAGRKVLLGIYESGVEDGRPYARPLCLYDSGTDAWRWFYEMSEARVAAGMASSPLCFEMLEKELRRLADA